MRLSCCGRPSNLECAGHPFRPKSRLTRAISRTQDHNYLYKHLDGLDAGRSVAGMLVIARFARKQQYGEGSMVTSQAIDGINQFVDEYGRQMVDFLRALMAIPSYDSLI